MWLKLNGYLIVLWEIFYGNGWVVVVWDGIVWDCGYDFGYVIDVGVGWVWVIERDDWGFLLVVWVVWVYRVGIVVVGG